MKKIIRITILTVLAMLIQACIPSNEGQVIDETTKINRDFDFTLDDTVYKHNENGCTSIHYTSTGKTELRSTAPSKPEYESLGWVLVTWVDNDKTTGTKSAIIDFEKTVSNVLIQYESTAVDISLTEYGTWPTVTNGSYTPAKTSLVKGTFTGAVNVVNKNNAGDIVVIKNISFSCSLPAIIMP